MSAKLPPLPEGFSLQQDLPPLPEGFSLAPVPGDKSGIIPGDASRPGDEIFKDLKPFNEAEARAGARGAAVDAVKNIPRRFIGNVAGVADWVLGGVADLGAILKRSQYRQYMKNDPTRLRPGGPIPDEMRPSFLRGASDAAIEEYAENRAAAIRESFGEPVKKVMQYFGFGDVYDESDVAVVNNYLGKKADEGASFISERSGGRVSKLTAQAQIEEFLAAVGLTGTAAGLPAAGRAIERQAQRAAGTERPPLTAKDPGVLARDVFRRQGEGGAEYRPNVEPEASAAPEAPPAAPDLSDPIVARREALARERTAQAGLTDSRKTLEEVDAYRNAEQEAYNLMRRGASTKEVEARLARAGKDSPLARAMAQLRARREQVAGAKSGFEVDGVEAEIVGPGPRWEPGPTPTYGADPALPAPRSRIDRNLLAGLGVAGAATLLATNWDVLDAEEAAALIGVGALAGMPRTAPLGALRNAADGTLKTLERLDPKKFEFGVEEIRNQAKRADVTQNERNAIEAVLSKHSGDRITAMELMRGLGESTEFARLTPEVLKDYATYGLDRIGRANFGDFENARTTVYKTPFGLSALEARIDDTGGHTYFPNSFGHVRSFDNAEGVRHVVEIQNNQAQYAGEAMRGVSENAEGLSDPAIGKVHDATISLARAEAVLSRKLSFEAPDIPALARSIAKALEGLDTAHFRRWRERKGYDWVSDTEVGMQDLLEFPEEVEPMEALRIVQEERGRLIDYLHELRGAAALEDFKQIKPLMKDWWKRAINEEIGQAAKTQTKLSPEQVAQYRKDIEEFKAKMAELEKAQEWTYANRGELISLARDLEALSADLHAGATTPEVVRDFMEAVVSIFPPEGRARWQRWMEERADETPAFLESPRDWGNSGHTFPKVLRKFIRHEIGRGPDWEIYKNLLDDAETALLNHENSKTNIIRFATADTVAKVEKWEESRLPQTGTVITANDYAGNRVVGSHLGQFGDFERTGRFKYEADGIYEELVPIDPYRQRIGEPKWSRAGSMPDGRREDLLRRLRDAGPETKEEALARAMETYNAKLTLDGIGPNHPKRAQRLADAERNWLAAADRGHFFADADHAAIFNRYASDVEKYLRTLGGKPYKDEFGATWLEVSLPKPDNARVPLFGGRDPAPGGGPRGGKQAGAIDPDLARALAQFGLGAGLGYLFSEPGNKEWGAAMGALLVGAAKWGAARSPELNELGRNFASGVERAAGVLSTAVGDLSQPVLRRMRLLEIEGLRGTYRSIDRVAPFIKQFRALDEGAKARLASLLFTGDHATALKEMGPELKSAFRAVTKELQHLGQEMVKAGLIKAPLLDYFPRVVRDYEGLLNALDTPLRDALDKRLQEADGKMVAGSGRHLNEVERSAIINKFLAQRRAGASGKPSFSKQRKLDAVPEELLQFYEPPEVSLTRYVQSATWAVERAKFFGRYLQRDAEGVLDIHNSIGNFVRAEREAGRLRGEDVAKLQQLLEDRFVGGEQSGGVFGQWARTSISAALIGNLASAAIQIGDIFHSVFLNGLMPTVRAVATTLDRGPARVTARDYGLVNHLAEELVTAGSAARAADFVFKWSGFRMVDLFAKDVFLTAAADKAAKQARTRSGVEAMRKKYGEYFGARDFEQLIADLQAKNRTVLVDEYLMAELSRVQPVTRLEVPPAFNANPNLRIAWILKTWMLKQFDLARREVWREFAAGNYGKGLEMGLRVGAALYLSNMTGEAIRSWMLGREQEEWKLETVPMNILKTFALNEYLLDKIEDGRYSEAFLDATLPPHRMFDEILRGDPSAVKYLPIIGRHLESYGSNALREIPGLGEVLEIGVEAAVGEVPPGRERFNERAERRRELEERREDPAYWEDRRLRREEAR